MSRSPETPWPRRVVGALLAITVAATGACGGAHAEADELVLVQVRPEVGSRVYLNEPLVLTFSEPLDLASITPESVLLTSPRGAARGQWTVEGEVLRFEPDPVWDAALTSGGYEPGAEHRLTLVGFPRLGGVRAVGGATLDWTRRLTFRAADPDDGPALYDLGRTPTGCEPVWLEGADGRRAIGDLVARVGVGEPLRLVCAEPLDPSSLVAADFRIERPAFGREPAFSTTVSAHVVRNAPASGDPEARCAVIELVPLDELQPSRSPYQLRVRRDARLADMGGNPAFLGLQETSFRFQVEHLPTSSADRVRLEFHDRTSASAERVLDVDGTAAWRGDGRVRVAYPRAAGPGGGDRVLSGELSEAEVSATRIDVPAGSACTLPASRGLAVVRCQGRLRIEGDLVRPSAAEGPPPPIDLPPGSLAWTIQQFATGQGERLEDAARRRGVPLTDETRPALEAARLQPHETFAARLAAHGATLEEFLEAARASGTDWTVLVAGGDLVVEGRLDLASQVVLVAGGRIRLDGRVSLEGPPGLVPERVFTVGDGGGLLGASGLQFAPLDVTAKAPDRNPLDTTLTWAVASAPLPRQVLDRYLWRGLRVGGVPGNGAIQVRWLPADGPVDPDRAVDHPSRLPEGPVRMLALLTVAPGGVWDPPSLDFVELAWLSRR